MIQAGLKATAVLVPSQNQALTISSTVARSLSEAGAYSGSKP